VRKQAIFRPAPVNFWSALNSAEREDFRSVARQRTFARGARLMEESESADYVILILTGRTRIFVQNGGTEHVLAERGPGQLVGERGALRVSVRSATVVALETVQALVVTTSDFANFVSAHPGLLSVVESQVHERLTEEPAGRAPLTHAGENCTVVLTDVVGFGALHRNDPDRQIIRQALYEMTQDLLDELGEVCSCEDRGDGLLLVIPPSIPTARAMKYLHRELPPRLRRHNRTYGTYLQVQLRVAVNVGPVVSDQMGMTGEAIIRTARLLDAPPLKEGIAESRAFLGIIVSAFVYDTAIKHGEGGIDPGSYHQVQVSVKESSFAAWMSLIDAAPFHGPLMDVASDRTAALCHALQLDQKAAISLGMCLKSYFPPQVLGAGLPLQPGMTATTTVTSRAGPSPSLTSPQLLATRAGSS
jgi:class 3 adenylate cyclase